MTRLTEYHTRKSSAMATYDAFISHSSKNTAVAARIEKALETEYNVWLDHSDIQLGALLRKELQQNIENSRVVILLWSEPAAASRWIAAEVLPTGIERDRTDEEARVHVLVRHLPALIRF